MKPESPLPRSRSGRITKKKIFDDFESFDDTLEEETDRETKKALQPQTKRIRRFKKNRSRIRKPRTCGDVPAEYETLKAKTDAGVIPETVYYRASSNTMFIPSITADMIKDDGKNLTVESSSDDYFKYERVRQTTKLDHANSLKVFKIIDAVRNRPVIWDQRLACHQNASFVRRAWEQLDAELGLDDEYPLAKRKQIWKSKKDYYSFAVNTDTLGKWRYRSAMEFYLPMVNFRAVNCLRPTVSNHESPSDSTLNDQDKIVLGHKSIKCSPFDKTNVLIFVLKSLHDIGSANPVLMEKHGNAASEIFSKNLKAMMVTPNEHINFKDGFKL